MKRKYLIAAARIKALNRIRIKILKDGYSQIADDFDALIVDYIGRVTCDEEDDVYNQILEGIGRPDLRYRDSIAHLECGKDKI